MMAELGVCTWTFGDLPLGEIARRVATWGFDGLGLLGDPGAYPVCDTVALLADHDLSVIAVTPGNVDLAHLDPAIRGRALDYYFELLDWAAELNRPMIGCHNYVGRTTAIGPLAQEVDRFVDAVDTIARRAHGLGLRVVLEALNRYESHLLNTADQGLALIDRLADRGSAAAVGLLLDAYHMNIEEAFPATALRQAGDRLWLYHAADSNRRGIGRGHIDFKAQFAALDEIGYEGPVVLECTAPLPDPFAAGGEDPLKSLAIYYRESRQWLLENGR
jgi:sugar phosphate isomerase/epimerase